LERGGYRLDQETQRQHEQLLHLSSENEQYVSCLMLVQGGGAWTDHRRDSVPLRSMHCRLRMALADQQDRADQLQATSRQQTQQIAELDSQLLIYQQQVDLLVTQLNTRADL